MSFIYDEPGPRARRRIRMASGVVVVLLAILVALGLHQFAATGQFDPSHWTPFGQLVVWRYLGVGLLGTLQSAGVVAVLGAPLGALLAFGRLSTIRPVRWLCTTYIEVARTVPVLLLIYLMLFGLPQLGINAPVLWKMAIPLTFVSSAVFAEIVRAGVISLPKGQSEAALSLGLRKRQATRHVILPQALRNVSPSLLTQLVSLLKDTTLGYIVAYTDLLYRGQLLTSFLNQLIPTYLVVAGIYLTVSGSLTALAWHLQKRIGRSPASLTVLPSIPVQELLEH